jgi:hypothetical protein
LHHRNLLFDIAHLFEREARALIRWRSVRTPIKFTFYLI